MCLPLEHSYLGGRGPPKPRVMYGLRVSKAREIPLELRTAIYQIKLSFLGIERGVDSDGLAGLYWREDNLLRIIQKLWAAVVASLCISLSLGGDSTRRGESDGVPPFVLQVSGSQVFFSGGVPDKTQADLLANALLSARPDLQVKNAGIVFDSAADLPTAELLRSLLIEVVLSLHEGEVEIGEDFVLVGGLTDSIVTTSVIRIRLAPLLGDRVFIDQICQVPTADLPEVPILLSSGESRQPFAFDLDVRENESAQFTPPGLLLDKVRRLIDSTADMGLLQTGRPTTDDALQNVASIPVAVGAVGSPAGGQSVLPVPAVPLDPYVAFGSLLFVRNTASPQQGQRDQIAGIAASLNSLQWAEQAIELRVSVYRSGAPSFAKWLGERRRDELRQWLIAAGVAEGRIKAKLIEVTDGIDQGLAQVMVMRLPPVVAIPVAEETEQDQSGSEVAVESE